MRFVLFSEPLSGVAPKVKDNEVGSIKKVARLNHLITLICPAQGFPTPKFRYLLLLFVLLLTLSLKQIRAWIGWWIKLVG